MALTISSKTTPLIYNSRNIRASSPRKNVVTTWFHHVSLRCLARASVSLCVSCAVGSNDASSIASRRRSLASASVGVVCVESDADVCVVLFAWLIVFVNEFRRIYSPHQPEELTHDDCECSVLHIGLPRARKEMPLTV